jgi:hypothetical protein
LGRQGAPQEWPFKNLWRRSEEASSEAKVWRQPRRVDEGSPLQKWREGGGDLCWLEETWRFSTECCVLKSREFAVMKRRLGQGARKGEGGWRTARRDIKWPIKQKQRETQHLCVEVTPPPKLIIHFATMRYKAESGGRVRRLEPPPSAKTSDVTSCNLPVDPPPSQRQTNRAQKRK